MDITNESDSLKLQLTLNVIFLRNFLHVSMSIMRINEWTTKPEHFSYTNSGIRSLNNYGHGITVISHRYVHFPFKHSIRFFVFVF